MSSHTLPNKKLPSKRKKSRYNDSPMVALMYLESIPQASYNQWLKKEIRHLSPYKPAGASSLEDMDSPTKKRHKIGYICENLHSWATQLNEYTESNRGGFVILPSVDQVRAYPTPTPPIECDYTRDGLKWRSDVRTCFQAKHDGLWKNVVIHFPNDGFFYVDETLLPLLTTNNVNARHMKTCKEGWAYLNEEVWTELAPFEDFARKWFGYDDPSKKLQRQIMYNDTANRMDISIRCPELLVGIDFVFEPGFPVPDVPEEFWF